MTVPMMDRALLGVGRTMVPVPGFVWKAAIRAGARKVTAGLGFMTADHRRVHHFVVVELLRAGVPLSLRTIAAGLDQPERRVEEILADLARRLTFLARDEHGAVTWAYPVTVEKTPHHAHVDTGEDAYSP
ncbi:MAG: hypothetical protein E4H03_03090 [Myxococcales bacterium]|nr:MAG: hypothetical protein E4H03_03090 [Myxococcales bacterium]